MIKEMLKYLNSKEWLVDDEDINIAKGVYELPSTIKELRIRNERIKKVYGSR